MIDKTVRFVLNNVSRGTIQRVVHLVTPVVGLWYRGRGVECPVCGAHYRQFMPYGYVGSRANALCPSCLALERHRLLWVFLREQTDLFSSSPRLLHIAPERCFMARLEKLLGDNYVTADLCSPLAKVKMDVQQIPFDDNSFDVIFCNHILEHVENDRLAMSELFRVMRPGGWGVMLSPVNEQREQTYEDPSITDEEGRERAFGQRDHVRDYGRDYPERLESAGFRVEAIDYVKMLPAEQVTCGGLRREVIYLVHKP